MFWQIIVSDEPLEGMRKAHWYPLLRIEGVSLGKVLIFGFELVQSFPNDVQ